MKQNKIYCVIVLSLLTISLACEKQELRNMDVDAEILREMEGLNIPSVVACVVNPEGIQWSGTYGYANEEYIEAATLETVYSLQSISKLFLSITLFQLWEKNLIDFENDINHYLPYDVRNPNYPDSVITPYMLLNHTSGLAWAGDEPLYDFHHFYSEEEPPLLADWLPEYIFPEGEHYCTCVWKNFPPGEKYLYSNIGTSLLGLIVEQISGMDYRDYCKKYILDPLGMTHSSFYLSELEQEKLVTPYNHAHQAMPFFTSRHYPAGFLNCSAIDFARFTRAILNYGSLDGQSIIKKSTLQKMLEIQNHQKGISYLWDHYLGGTVGHIGGGTGFSTCVVWHFENQTSFFLFSNTYNNAVYHQGNIYQLVKYQSQKTNPK